MADQFKARTLKRKNVKGLALNSTPKPLSKPSEGDAQIPGAIGNTDSNRTDTLEIGLEFRLDLRSEDLITLKELGAGNGGTVSKVMHASTKVVMARKVRVLISDHREGGRFADNGLWIIVDCRSFAWMPRRM
jgi:mitogen-activated protein kinase kinase